MCDSVEEALISESSDSEIIVVGDFNLPKLQWDQDDEDNYLTATNASSKKEHYLIDCFHKLGSQQISDVKNSQQRQLDLIFTTDFYNVTLIKKCVLLTDSHTNR
jgi:hypothetical protein